MFRHLHKPPVFIPWVAEWMRLFSDHFGRNTRFPFLVLHGPSQHGKTTFAKQLYGPQKTLLLSCQNVQQPNLKDTETYCVSCCYL